MKRVYHFAALVVLLSFSVLATGGCGSRNQAVEKESSIKVDTALIKKMNISQNTSYSGVIKGSSEEAVMAKESRRIAAVHVKEGQSVHRGQVLISLDRGTSDISVQQAQATLAAAQAAAASNQVQLQAAQRTLKRAQEMYNAGAASITELETAQDQVSTLSTGAVEAAVAQAQAGLNATRKNSENCEITSPINGIVGRIDVAVGDTASLQNPVVVINTTDNLEIKIKVSESDINSIRPGIPVEVWVDSIGKSLTGIIKSVASIADSTRSYPVAITLQNNPGVQAKSGMFAEVKLATQNKENILGIPMSAVLPQNGESVVFVVTNKKRSHQVRVETGISNGKYIEIVKGVKNGQTVVTKGNTLIEENTLLEISDGGAAR